MPRSQGNCYASSRRHSSQAVGLKKAGAAPGKDGSPMFGQKSTKLPCFGYSRYSPGTTVSLKLVFDLQLGIVVRTALAIWQVRTRRQCDGEYRHKTDCGLARRWRAIDDAGPPGARRTV